jgi:hypothetical protein
MYTLLCVTKNALVKSNTLAALNPTWAYFVMVSQKLLRTFGRISILNELLSFGKHTICL